MTLRDLLFIVAVAVLGLAGGLAIGRVKARREAAAEPVPATSSPASAIAAPSRVALPLTAVFFSDPTKHFSLADLRGKPVLIDFFASWCPPCLAVTPALHELAEAHRDGLHAIAVSVDQDHHAARLTTWPTSAAMPMLLADDGVDVAWGIELLPTILLLDADGIIRSGNLMRANPAATKAAIETALAGLQSSPLPSLQPSLQPKG